VLRGESQSYRFEARGTYQISLTVIDAGGNLDIGSLNISVRDAIDPIASAQGRNSVSVGSTVLLDGSGSTDNVGIIGWAWTFEEAGRTVELNGMTVEHRFDRAGSYDITLTVTDADGNTGTAVMTVVVKKETASWGVMPIVAIVVVSAIVAAIALMVRTKRSA
jgi:PKD repeat protein